MENTLTEEISNDRNEKLYFRNFIQAQLMQRYYGHREITNEESNVWIQEHSKDFSIVFNELSQRYNFTTAISTNEWETILNKFVELLYSIK